MNYPGQRKLTKIMRHLREGMLMNLAEEVVYRRNWFWDVKDESSRRTSSLGVAANTYERARCLIEVGSTRISDGHLRWTAARRLWLSAGADVLPFKRGGRPG